MLGRETSGFAISGAARSRGQLLPITGRYLSESQKKVNGMPKSKLSRDDILTAMFHFDQNKQNMNGVIRKWEDNTGFQYALDYEGKSYPPGVLMSIALGYPIRSPKGEPANRTLRELGFTVIRKSTPKKTNPNAPSGKGPIASSSLTLGEVTHGVGALEPDSTGKHRPKRLGDSAEVATAQRLAEASGAFDANDETDARSKTLRAIVQRRGQPQFRQKLIFAYAGTCAMTGCTVPDILEAAHIKPYMGEHSNHVTNGLLLRADVHTLFDLGLVRVHPDTYLIDVAERALPGYQHLAGVTLQLPADSSARPNIDALLHHHLRSAAEFRLE
jgi:hypothetical protein